MKVKLAFDKQGAEVEAPDRFRTRVLEPRYAPELPSAEAAISEALARPIGSASLEEAARGKKSAAIAVCDITRPAPNKLVLPHVLAALEKGGIPRPEIRILIATGLHREATPAELDEIVGAEILSAYSVDSHRARTEDEQTHLGRTSGGTEAYIDRRFVDADLGVTLGFIEPHLMAGFSGGRKLVSIGLAGEKTIKRLHSPLFIRDRQATEGSFPDNPLHRELLEISALAGHDFVLDVALTRTRGIAGVFAGNPAQAHAAGVEFVRQSTLASVDEPADVVITTSGGYPLDLTFYQAVKGITAAAHIVKPGGTILLAAACSEGLGSPEFTDMMRRSTTPEALLDELASAPVTIDQWQAEKLAIVAQKAKLAYCVPGVEPSDRDRLWGRAFEDPQRAINEVLSGLASDASVVLIPDGPYVFAQREQVPVGV